MNVLTNYSWFFRFHLWHRIQLFSNSLDLNYNKRRKDICLVGSCLLAVLLITPWQLGTTRSWKNFKWLLNEPPPQKKIMQDLDISSSLKVKVLIEHIVRPGLEFDQSRGSSKWLGPGGHQNGRGRVFPIILARQEPQSRSSCRVEYESTTFLEVNIYLKYFSVDKLLFIFFSLYFNNFFLQILPAVW